MARRTKAEAEATRESILDAAEQVFMEKGVAKASLEEIARAAGVTRGAVYWHFRNKQDILDAMLERVRAPIAEMIDEASSVGDSLDRLKQVCIIALQKLANDARYFRVYYILFHRNESDQAIEKHGELSEEAVTLIGEIFAKPENTARLHATLTPASAAFLLHTQMLGIFFDWLAAPDRRALSDMAPVLVEAAFRGLLADH